MGTATAQRGGVTAQGWDGMTAGCSRTRRAVCARRQGFRRGSLTLEHRLELIVGDGARAVLVEFGEGDPAILDLLVGQRLRGHRPAAPHRSVRTGRKEPRATAKTLGVATGPLTFPKWKVARGCLHRRAILGRLG